MRELDLREIVKLEDKSEYYVAGRLSHNKNFYVMLINEDDIIIQKEINQDGEIKFLKIDSEIELKEMLFKFAKQRLY